MIADAVSPIINAGCNSSRLPLRKRCRDVFCGESPNDTAAIVCAVLEMEVSAGVLESS